MFKDKLEKVYDGNLSAFVDGEYPKHCKGIIGALLHPLIQIGYGLSVDNVQVVLEGFAYSYHSTFPIQYDEQNLPDIYTLGKGNLTFLQVLEKLRLDDDLFQFMRSQFKVLRGDSKSSLFIIS